MSLSYFKDADQHDIFPVPDTYWDDLRTPVNTFHPIPAREPNWAAYKGGYVLEFTDEATEGNEKAVSFVVQLPHKYKEGTSIIPHVHWIGEDNTAGNVYWKFTHSWANQGVALPGESTLYLAAANSGTTDVHNFHSFSAISGTGKTISSMLICSLTRHSSDALDTFDGKKARLLEFDFHFEVDTPGSRETLTK